MNLLQLTTAILLFVSASVLSAGITVVSNDANWPADAVVDTGAPGTSLVTQAGVAHILDYEAERDVKNQRPLLQTFDLPANTEELLVTDIYVYYWGGGSSAVDSFDVLIFEIDDVFSAGGVTGDDDITNNPPPNAGNAGVPIYSGSVTVGPASVGTRETSSHVLHLSLNDGPTLKRRPGNAGYGLMLYNPDTDGAYPFKWKGERDPYLDPPSIDEGPYRLGRPYSDNEASFQESQDLSLAIDGLATPASSLLSIAAGAPGSFTLSAATGHFDALTIEGASDLSANPIVWTPAVILEGDGTIQDSVVTPPSSPYFYRFAE